MVFFVMLPKSAQAWVCGIGSVLTTLFIVVLSMQGYYPAAGVVALGFLALVVAAVVLAKQARSEKDDAQHTPFATGAQPQPPPANAYYAPGIVNPANAPYLHDLTAPKNLNTWQNAAALGGLGLFFLCAFIYGLWNKYVRPRATDAGNRMAQEAQIAPQRPQHAPRPPKRALALYYPWYQTPAVSRRWAHQQGVNLAHKRIADHTHYPASGPYDSADPAVIDRHLRQAEAAGIDTLVCSWWGPKDPTDRALRLLLSRAAKTPVTICVLWEQLSGPDKETAPSRDLTYLLQTFGKQPAYFKVNDRPVVFAFDRVCRGAAPDVWAAALENLQREEPPGALVLGDALTPPDDAVWGGGFNLGNQRLLWNQQTPGDCARALHQSYGYLLDNSPQRGKITVVSVTPGVDDRKPNVATGQRGSTFVDRAGGGLYKALWTQAIADDPDWILVNSFNQWHNGTEIEPSAEFGDAYLRQTRDFVARFKRRATP